MRKTWFVILGALALAGCGAGSVSDALSSTPISAESPAPAAKVVIDDEALEMAWKGFDAALDAIALAREAGVLKPGTPKAIAVANGIDKVLAAFQGAEHAAAGLSTTSYLTALAELKLALADFRTVLRSK